MPDRLRVKEMSRAPSEPSAEVLTAAGLVARRAASAARSRHSASSCFVRSACDCSAPASLPASSVWLDGATPFARGWSPGLPCMASISVGHVMKCHQEMQIMQSASLCYMRCQHATLGSLICCLDQRPFGLKRQESSGRIPSRRDQQGKAAIRAAGQMAGHQA